EPIRQIFHTFKILLLKAVPGLLGRGKLHGTDLAALSYDAAYGPDLFLRQSLVKKHGDAHRGLHILYHMLHVYHNAEKHAEQKNTRRNRRHRCQGEPDISAYIYKALFQAIPKCT